MFNYLVVGCGYAGAVIARLAAEEGNQVLVIDRRKTIAGNMYDEFNDSGILVHKYGPHISVMNEKKVYDFLSRFTEWVPYEHRVNAEIDGKEVPLPINFTSIDCLFEEEKAHYLKKILCDEYGEGNNVPILEMRKSSNLDIREFAAYIFEKVFLHYTEKMWGLSPDEISPTVTGRVPVRLSYDDRHFTHKYQVMPKNGFTKLFFNMLNHENIKVQLETEATEVIKLDLEKKKIYFNDKLFKGKVVYTGALDELMGYEYGVLPYRSLKIVEETYQINYIQNTPVLNWPDTRKETRRTEMKRLTQQEKEGVTTTLVEIPGAYDKSSENFSEPYYPIVEEHCMQMYEKYRKTMNEFPNFCSVGRLADYKYYNMEATIVRAMEVYECELRKV